MEYKTLGNTEINVSRLCFGTLTLGPLQAAMKVDAGARVVARAIELGVNFCDTAELYETYPYIRRAMELTKKYDLIVASKTYAVTKKQAQRAVEDARKALNRDYIDIFMLHEQESEFTLKGHGEALEYFYECKQRGIIKAAGASMHHVAAACGAAKEGLDIIHPLINIEGLGIADGGRADMEKAVKKAHDKGIGVYAMKALGGGSLFKRAEECLSYVLGLDFIDSIAVGMQSEAEAEANAGFFKNGAFTPGAKKALLKKTRRLHIEGWCAGCGACAEKCGQKALSINSGKAVCEHKKCILCGYCAAACEYFAIKVV